MINEGNVDDFNVDSDPGEEVLERTNVPVKKKPKEYVDPYEKKGHKRRLQLEISRLLNPDMSNLSSRANVSTSRTMVSSGGN